MCTVRAGKKLEISGQEDRKTEGSDLDSSKICKSFQLDRDSIWWNKEDVQRGNILVREGDPSDSIIRFLLQQHRGKSLTAKKLSGGDNLVFQRNSERQRVQSSSCKPYRHLHHT